MQAGNKIDHIIFIKIEGSKTAMSNLRFLHVWCHFDSQNAPERN